MKKIKFKFLKPGSKFIRQDDFDGNINLKVPHFFVGIQFSSAKNGVCNAITSSWGGEDLAEMGDILGPVNYPFYVTPKEIVYKV